MSDLYALGPRGEEYAVELLRRRGYQVLQRNYRCRSGEIDVIAWQADTLVFVEVRAREETAAASPAETVDAKKRARILNAARHYLARRLGDRPPPNIRYDVVWITARSGKILSGGVIPGAFSA
jgi:putative endonuclease